MYYDLNVPWSEESQARLPALLKLLERFGYGAVGINHVSVGKLPKAKCPIQKAPTQSTKKQPIRQYTRLTLVLDNPQQNYGINSSNDVIKSYDIIAVQPTTEKMFQVACATLEIDLITFDFRSPRPPYFPIKHGFVRQALDRGISFEIIYGNSIVDLNLRKQAILMAQNICRVTKGKNVILTSGADSEWILRAPTDTMNLAGIFGIPPHCKKQALCENQQRVVEHAASRKLTYRTTVATLQADVVDGAATAKNDLEEDFISF